ncbi:MAG: anthranilate synthase component I [Gammaproteobacteria bacterium]|nr:anthranilate synthase component I [Gammaproteobacteria bacterium]
MKITEFERYVSAGYTRIPLSAEIIADFDSPLSVFLKVANLPFTFLFESVQGGEKWGRYSVIGLPCARVIRIYGNDITISDSGEEVERFTVDDPLQWIDDYQQKFRIPDIPELPRITGGLVGYFGYDTIRYVEPTLGKNPHPDPLGNPDILLMVASELVVFDNLSGKLTMLNLVDPAQPNAYQLGLARLREVHEAIRSSAPIHISKEARSVYESDFKSGFTEKGFKDAVRKIKQYITDGDCMQVVISQRLSVPYSADSLDLYRALRTLNPSPYMFYLNLDDHQVVGASPEILVRLENNEVTVRPLAGTRPRGRTEAEDRAHEESLLKDPKELAEHLMLIDLGRNDIGRIAQTGSVKVTDKYAIERYSHVMHIVSNVIGELKPEYSPMDVLRATFPAGTLSGAPKVRAMEIIQELEPVKRGIYSGAVGYLSWNGNMDTAIAIRTAVVQNGELTVQAGAGIVYDSDPDTEWEETMNKARAVIRAVAMAEAGLDRMPVDIDPEAPRANFKEEG